MMKTLADNWFKGRGNTNFLEANTHAITAKRWLEYCRSIFVLQNWEVSFEDNLDSSFSRRRKMFTYRVASEIGDDYSLSFMLFVSARPLYPYALRSRPGDVQIKVEVRRRNDKHKVFVKGFPRIVVGLHLEPDFARDIDEIAAPLVRGVIDLQKELHNLVKQSVDVEVKAHPLRLVYHGNGIGEFIRKVYPRTRLSQYLAVGPMSSWPPNLEAVDSASLYRRASYFEKDCIFDGGKSWEYGPIQKVPDLISMLRTDSYHLSVTPQLPEGGTTFWLY